MSEQQKFDVTEGFLEKSENLQELYKKLNETKKQLQETRQLRSLVTSDQKSLIMDKSHVIQDTMNFSHDNQDFDHILYSKENYLNSPQKNLDINRNLIEKKENKLQDYQKFYERGMRILQSKNEMEKNIFDEIVNLSNSKKLSENSYKILVKQIEKNLTMLLMDVDQNNQKQLDFDQIGRVLTLIGAFRILKYDNKFTLSNEGCFFDEHENQDRIQLEVKIYIIYLSKLNVGFGQTLGFYFFHLILQLQEQLNDQTLLQLLLLQMCFHEQLWYYMTKNSDADIANIEIVYSVLRILLDPVKLPDNEIGQILDQYLQKFQFQENSQNKEKTIIPWSTLELVKKFKQMMQNQLAYQSIGIANKLQKEQIQYQQNKDKECTFRPKVNTKSQLLDIKNLSKIDDTLNKSTNSSFSIGQVPPQDRYKILYKKQELSQLKLIEKKKLLEQKEQEECTFQPQLSQKNGNIEWTTTVERLFNNDALIEKEDMRIRNLEIQRNKEMEQCSFKPQIHNFELEIVEQLPKGFESTVERMRQSNEQQLKKKQAINHIPVGENYEKLRKQKVQPFSFLNRQNQSKTQPFLFIDITISQVKSVRIPLYPGDKASKVARGFALTYSLTREKELGLKELIQSQIDEYNQNQLD